MIAAEQCDLAEMMSPAMSERVFGQASAKGAHGRVMCDLSEREYRLQLRHFVNRGGEE